MQNPHESILVNFLKAQKDRVIRKIPVPSLSTAEIVAAVFAISLTGLLITLFVGFVQWSLVMFPEHPIMVVSIWFGVPALISGLMLVYFIQNEDEEMEEEVLEIDDDEF